MDLKGIVDEMRGWLDLRALPGHYSTILLDQLAAGVARRTVHSGAVLDEIGKIQVTWRKLPAREPTQFMHEPLRGLWKQHYSQPSFLARNLHNELERKASKGPVRRLATAVSEGADLGPAIHDLVIGGYERRAARGALTGEWIVFAKNETGRSFFLALATHGECDRVPGEDDLHWQRRSDALIYERVAACRAEFTQLSL